VANGLEIPALLSGVAAVVRLAADDPLTVGPRPGQDGRPLAAYRGGGWYYGVYWTGAQGAWGRSQESYSVSLSVGVDVTRVWARSPTMTKGEWFTQDGELYERVGYVAQLLLNTASGVARYCNAALAALEPGGPSGVFREHFDGFTTGGVRTESPVGWLLAKDDDPHLCYVCSLRFSGLTYHKLSSEMPTL